MVDPADVPAKECEKNNMADPVIVPAKESEKAAPVAVAETAKRTAEELPAPVSDRQWDWCDGRYICDCMLCICGAWVEDPGEVCYVCTRFH
ncbi:hypothetical protein C8A00DRAFT_30498 [Chaetomidium leptoderma]|uniref:Uncharacterized protein n=1 Tax=Chaetomidium leptoderma TaxID=669021 RepID=A0AAN6VUD9_9PEZI|nr:hypothetical protein C8A00DRAFT_30498 [Chaetomidium leptoderma]